MMRKQKLILMDIDGTLLNTDWKMLPYTKKILTSLHEHGILLGIASGRPVDDISFHTQNWDLPFQFDILVGLNGCEIQNNVTNTYSLSHELSPEQLKTATHLMLDHFECIPFLYRGSQIHALEVNEVIKTSAIKSGKEPVQVDLETMCKEPCVKVMFRTRQKETIDQMEQYLKTIETPGLKWFKTQSTLIEVSDPAVSKAIALPTLCQQLDLDNGQIIACGDTTNDNEMLKAAGLGICLKNGTEDTKACADEITELDNDHDGLAHHFVKKHPELFKK